MTSYGVKYEKLEEKILEYNKLLKYNNNIVNLSLYLVKIGLENKNRNNSDMFNNKIIELTYKLKNIEEMEKVINVIDFFCKKHSQFNYIIMDLKYINNLWNGIYGWDNYIIF